MTTVRVLQLSDVHLTESGREVAGRDPDTRLRTVLDAYRATGTRPDLVLLTGDLADDGSAAACRRLREAVGEFSAPVLAVPGNHDSPATVREVFEAETAEVGGWRVVGVDTSRPGRIDGEIDVEREMRRLDGYDGRPTLLAMHHPPMSRSEHPMFQLRGADGLLAALAERPHVRAVLTGHLHDPFELRGAAGTPVLGCPSTLLGFLHHGADPEVPGGRPTGARLLELGDDGSVASRVLEA